MVEHAESAALERLLAVTRAKLPLGADAPDAAWVHRPDAAAAPHYANRNERLEIDFTVEKLAFPELQTMDPRLVRIAPGMRNEYHRHAHESLFVILSGVGEVCLGDRWHPVAAGDVAFVPRWIFHQTRNASAVAPLELLAVTDFGFTSAVLGDYDHRTRLAAAGEDAGPAAGGVTVPGTAEPLDLVALEGPALVEALRAARPRPGATRAVRLRDPGASGLLGVLAAAGLTALPARCSVDPASHLVLELGG